MTNKTHKGQTKFLELTHTTAPWRDGRKYAYLVCGEGYRGFTGDVTTWRRRTDVRMIIQRNLHTGSDWTIYVHKGRR